jgi:DnaJ-class molecular chaperone
VWTDVSLSVREAARGCRKPVDVCLRRVCGRCGGRGEVWTERCPSCAGTGVSTAAHEVYVSVPSRRSQ